MLSIAVSLGAGLLFGIGLTVSQMINPAKIIGFLDLAGNWDPTLAMVFIGALAVTVPGFWLVRRRSKPMLGEELHLPTAKAIDAKLVRGSILFGVGWGASGLCPGPALAAMSSGLVPVFLFVGAMIAGMVLFKVLPVPD